MSNKQLRLFAKDIIYSVFGTEISNNDVVLLEASAGENNVDYLLFGIKGRSWISYRCTKNSKGYYTTEIINERTDEELTIVN